MLCRLVLVQTWLLEEERVFSADRLIGVRCANALTDQPLYAMRVSMVLTLCNLRQCAHWWACGRHYAEHVWFSAFLRLSFVHAALENVLLCRRQIGPREGAVTGSECVEEKETESTTRPR